ncbi:MAG: MBL fold metallo-hydrolase, partial [Steroidobacteraceae bacterium]
MTRYAVRSTPIRAALIAFALCIPFAPLRAEPAFPVIHRVDGGAGEMFANAYIIEGRSGLVVVDSFLSRKASRSLSERARDFNKPILALVVTHGHPDHYGGIAQVVAGSSAIPVVAT